MCIGLGAQAHFCFLVLGVCVCLLLHGVMSSLMPLSLLQFHAHTQMMSFIIHTMNNHSHPPASSIMLRHVPLRRVPLSSCHYLRATSAALPHLLLPPPSSSASASTSRNPTIPRYLSTQANQQQYQHYDDHHALWVASMAGVGVAAAAVGASLLLANGLSSPSPAQMEAAAPEAAPVPAAPAAATQVKEKIFENKKRRG